MLHVGVGLAVKFASWVHGAFEGMEVELLEYAEEHLLRSSDKHVRRASGSPNQRQHLTKLIRLRQFLATLVSPYDMPWTAMTGGLPTRSRSELSSGLLSYAASMVEAFEVSRGVQRSRDAAIAVASAVPLDQLKISNRPSHAPHAAQRDVAGICAGSPEGRAAPPLARRQRTATPP
jgi:hypothetical protein